MRLKNNKIYIEEDWTEEGIATDLLREGVPKKDIVLFTSLRCVNTRNLP